MYGKYGKVEISAPDLCNDSIVIDGHEAREAVRAWTLTHEVGQVARLDMDVMVISGVTFQGSAYVGVSAACAALLVELGWLPPGDDRRLGGVTEMRYNDQPTNLDSQEKDSADG